MDTPTIRPTDDRSLGELFTQLMREMSTLVRQEVTVARNEMTQKASKVGKDAAMLAAGGIVAYTGALAVIAAIILMLIRAGMPAWGAALLVGVVVAAIGAYLIDKGIKALKSDNLAPERTISNLKEDARWLKEQMS
jgi:hypothetical protein